MVANQQLIVVRRRCLERRRDEWEQGEWWRDEKEETE
jgi:hypothetical protein